MLPRLRLVYTVIAICLMTMLTVAPGLNAQDATATPPDPTNSLPTLTETPLLIATFTETATLALEPTFTETATATLTLEPSLTAAPLPSDTATAEIIGTPTADATGTETSTATVSETLTLTRAATATLTAIATAGSIATASSTPIGSNIPVLYSETFENLNMGEWLYLIDRWLVPSDGGYALHVTNMNRHLPVGPGYVGDVVIQANVQMTTGGVALGVHDSGVGYYRAQLNMNGQVGLYRTNVLMATAVVLPSSAGQWRNFQLVVIGNSINVVVDGVQVLSATDPDPLPPGTLFVGAEAFSSSDFLLDNLLIQGTIVDPQSLPPDSYHPEGVVNQLNVQQILPLDIPAGSSGKIVYHQYDPGSDHDEIYIMDANGGNPTRLTNNIATDVYPALSLDGQIAFVSNRDGNNDLYTMNADGSNVVRRTNSVENKYFPDWAPDSSKIVFNYNFSANIGQGEIHELYLSTGSVAYITFGTMPKWSPDGQKLVFHRPCGVSGNPNPCAQIHTVNALDGSNEQLLTPFTTITWANASPEWSPDGSEIAYAKFSSDPLPQPGIIVMDSTTGATKRSLATIDIPNQSYQELSWSPDGTQIVFNEYTPTGRNMSVVSSQGGGKIVLNTTGGSPSFGLVLAQPPTPTPTVTPTPPPTPQVCDLALSNYATVPVFLTSSQALSLQVLFIQPNQITVDNTVSRLELRRIKDYLMQDSFLLNLPITDVRRYRLINIPGFIVEPYIINQVTIGNSFFVSSSPIGWLVTSFGLQNAQCSGFNSTAINAADFSFLPNVATTNLYSLTVDNRLQDGAGHIISPPLDTARNLGAFLDPYISGLGEYQTNISLCSPSDPSCPTRVYNRMIIDANNRFDDTIIESAQRYGVPPLILKLVLMQESNLVPAFPPNFAGAAGIAQFTAAGGAGQMVQDGRAPQGITTGNQYRDLIDGLTSTCQFNPVSGYPVSEDSCVDFSEARRAIDDAAYYLKWNYNYIVSLVTGSLSTAWDSIPIQNQEALLWAYTLASYNAGPGNATDALRAATNLTLQAVCPEFAAETRKYLKNIRNGTPGEDDDTNCG